MMVGNTKDSRLFAPLPDNKLFLREIVILLRQWVGKVSIIKWPVEQFVTLPVPLTEHKTAKPGEHDRW